MNKNGTIIIIEDDEEDLFVFEEAFTELNYPNQRMYFQNGLEALEYLRTTPDRPFIIISDINLPKLDGLQVRKKILMDAELAHKCTPYVFFTTALIAPQVLDAYRDHVQGFFVKPASFDETKDTIRVMMEYWKKCAGPNNF